MSNPAIVYGGAHPMHPNAARQGSGGQASYLPPGDHAPETYRISTVRNMDARYDAFDVVPGQRLYLEPEARVRIW